MKLRLQVLVLALSSAASSEALAQVGAKAETTPATSESDVEVGDTSDALPGVHRVGVPGVQGPRASSSFNLNYGFTEGQNGASSAHHRIGTSLAGAIAPWSFAALGMRVDFRHDIHGSDDTGSDSGSVLDVTPHLRLGAEISPGIHVGAEARLRLPGATVGETGGPSPEFDGRGLFAYSGVPTWMFALHGGYKLGHGGSILSDAANMRDGDRIALGISQFDAILMGLGLVKTIGTTDILGEVTSEMLIGSGAPSVFESPLRLAGGVRHPLARNFWLNGLAEASIGARAPSEPGDALVPIEPRIQAIIGVTWRFLAPAEPLPPEPEEVVEEAPIEKPEEAVVEEKAPAVVTSSLRVTVVDFNGHPISDAEVSVEQPTAEGSDGEVRNAPLEDTNIYALADVPVGEVEVTVKADLLKAHTETLTIEEGKPAEITIKLKKADSLGSQLRGLVRSYSGTGIQASVRVEPGKHNTMCEEDGSFELDLPPGVYTVIIEAEGYRSQRRGLRVRKEGVTVLNADLQESTK